MASSADTGTREFATITDSRAQKKWLLRMRSANLLPVKLQACGHQPVYTASLRRSKQTFLKGDKREISTVTCAGGGGRDVETSAGDGDARERKSLRRRYNKERVHEKEDRSPELVKSWDSSDRDGAPDEADSSKRLEGLTTARHNGGGHNRLYRIINLQRKSL